MMHRNLDRRVEVLVRLPGVRKVAEVGALLDLAFDADTSRLGARQRRGVDASTSGTRHLQEDADRAPAPPPLTRGLTPGDGHPLACAVVSSPLTRSSPCV